MEIPLVRRIASKRSSVECPAGSGSNRAALLVVLNKDISHLTNAAGALRSMRRLHCCVLFCLSQVSRNGCRNWPSANYQLTFAPDFEKISSPAKRPFHPRSKVDAGN
jgi:hypothetical protein